LQCHHRTGIGQVVKGIPDRALTLAFVDPENLNVNFETMTTLSGCGQVDLLILFADRMDLVRNVDHYEAVRPSVLDRMMGPNSRWRELWAKLMNRTPENICKLFADEYQSQLRDVLGYRVFGEHIGPLYRLIFASKNEKGLEFWNKVTRTARSGQRRLF
jgi:three-Cys-motif partner protein